MTTTKPMILASSSEWRASLLRNAGIACEARASGVDERAVEAGDPCALAAARALAKARALETPGRLVLGADQVVHLDGEVFGKPVDDAAWERQLRALRGRSHGLVTAVALLGPEPGRDERFEVHSQVRLRRDVTDAEIAAYVQIGEARGCAGGYMVERRGAWLIEAIDGDWTNVIGLPVFELISRLRKRGWRLEGPA